jgi:tetratricopeptide (TPR) repeat protein
MYKIDLPNFSDDRTMAVMAWLSSFRGHIDFAAERLETFLSLANEKDLSDALPKTLDILEKKGWLLRHSKPYTYSIHPLFPLSLSITDKSKQVFVRFFQTLAQEWSESTDKNNYDLSSLNFPVNNYENLNNALWIALEEGSSIEFLISVLDNYDALRHEPKRRIQRLERIVTHLENKNSSVLLPYEQYEYIACMDLLANVYQETQQSKLAEALYHRVLLACDTLSTLKLFSTEKENTYLSYQSRSTALLRLASLYRERYEWAESQNFHQEAIEINRKIGVSEALADALMEAGLWHKAQRHYKEGEFCFAEAILNTTDLLKKGRILLNYAALLDDKGDLETSLQLNQQALTIFENYPKHAPMGALLTNMGLLYERLYDKEESVICLKRAIQWYLFHSDWFSAAQCFQNLGNQSFQERALTDAADYFQRAKQIYQQVKAPLLEAEIWQNEAEVWRLQGHFEEAVKSGQNAAALFHKYHRLEGEAAAHINTANALIQLNELNEAEKLYLRALELHSQAHHTAGEGLVYQNLAELARRRNQYQEGIESLLKAAECFCELDALENLPRLIAYTNFYANFFTDKTILEKMALLLNEKLQPTVLEQILIKARSVFKMMSE